MKKDTEYIIWDGRTRSTRVVVNEQPYQDMHKHCIVCINTLLTEEAIDLVFRSYIELEEALFHLAIVGAYSSNDTFDTWYDHIMLIEQKLFNVLMPLCAYDGRVKKLLKKMDGGSAVAKMVKSEVERLTDANSAYGVWLKLRHAAAHSRLLVSGMHKSLGPIDQGGCYRHLYTNSFTISPKDFLRTGDINKKDCKYLLGEIERDGGDAKGVLRRAIRDIADVHTKVRDAAAPMFSESVERCKELISEIARRGGVGDAAVLEERKGGSFVGRFALTSDALRRYEKLKNKNTYITSVSTSIISTETRGDGLNRKEHE